MSEADPEPDEPGGDEPGGRPSDAGGGGEGVPILLNGEERSIPAGISAAGLLRELELDPRGVVVEVNRDIVRREALEETGLEAGDRVEIVRFVGGGRTPHREARG